MASAHLKNTGPEEWEIIAWQLHDRLEAERKRGKGAAEQLAKRALDATEETRPMAKADTVITQLQALRDRAEMDGDTAAADRYTDAIFYVRQAQGGAAAPAAEEPPAEEPTTTAEKMAQNDRFLELAKAAYARPLL